jgi:hypothetical protein
MRFYGDLGAMLLKRLNTKRDDDRILAVLAQMEQCMIVARKNFEADSLELRSIEEVYQYSSIELMTLSDGPTLEENESLEMDLNELETTYVKPSDAFLNTLPQVLKEVITLSSKNDQGSLSA